MTKETRSNRLWFHINQPRGAHNKHERETDPNNGSGKRLSSSFARFSISSVIKSKGKALLTPGWELVSLLHSVY